MHPIPELDTAGLRRFGLTTGALFALIFGLLLPWLAETRFPILPWALGGIVAAWSLASPDRLRPLYRSWMRFGQLANRVTTPILLSFVYMILFTPIGLIMRLVGHDPMRRRIDPDATSYREISRSEPHRSMERPF